MSTSVWAVSGLGWEGLRTTLQQAPCLLLPAASLQPTQASYSLSFSIEPKACLVCDNLPAWIVGVC